MKTLPAGFALALAAFLASGCADSPTYTVEPSPPTPKCAPDQLCVIGAELSTESDGALVLTVRVWNDGPGCLHDVEARAHVRGTYHRIISGRDLPAVLHKGESSTRIGVPHDYAAIDSVTIAKVSPWDGC